MSNMYKSYKKSLIRLTLCCDYVIFKLERFVADYSAKCLILLHDKNIDDLLHQVRKNGSFLFHVFIEK